jgi:Core-2/I-Branching enzyme
MVESITPAPTVSIAYLVLSHHRSDRVEALARRIHELSAHGIVYVHHDKKARDLPWKGHPPDYVRMVTPRVRVSWGHWSIVDATLRMIEFAKQDSDPDWYIVVSGEDWPICSLSAWEESLVSGRHDALVEARLAERVPRDVPIEHDRFLRYQHRWFTFLRPSNAIVRKSTSLVGYALCRMTRSTKVYLSVFNLYGRGWALGLSRSGGLPPGWQYHQGSQWMAFNRRAAATVLDHPDRTALVAHFSRSLVPDEGFIHTILYNTPGVLVSSTPTSFAPWARDWQGHLMLGVDDFGDIRRAGTPFARKVDPEYDADLLPLIDSMVDTQRRSNSVAEGEQR